ncbi:MAG: ABC transporter ATP-binding protein [Clostridia bacterium]|nr:ABC transporter ATP-binding protein [Clostridia bacterium]
MLKLVKFLKPFLFLIIAAIALLYIQAMADLALPDYMSNIVNIGIQQSGVDSAVPNVMTKKDMDDAMYFSSEEDKKYILSNYDLISSDHSDYKEYEKLYASLDKQDIYALKKIGKEDKKVLELVMSQKILAVAGIKKALAGDLPSGVDMGGFQIPKGIDYATFMSMLTTEQRLTIADMINKQFISLGDTMVIQAASAVVKESYVDMGLDIARTQRNYILGTGGLMLLVTLIGAICTISVGFLAAKIASGLGRNLRSRIFKKVSSFSNKELDQFSTSSLITRSTNDVTQIQNMMVMLIRMVFYAPIIGVGAIIRAVDKSVSMSWIIALAVIILISLIATVFVIAMPKFKMVQKLIDKLNLVTRENLTGLMVIRAFNTQKFEEKRFDDANKDLTKTSLFVNRVMVFMMPAMMVIMNGTMLLIVWVGAHQIAESTMLVGDMMAFMQYALQVIFAFLMMSMMFIMIPRASVSAQRIAEVLETEVSITDSPEPKKFNKEMKGSVEFRNMSFKFLGAEENMLKNISFTAEPGKTTAIIGSTGSGKSTILNLIPRFYDVSEGEILIDGINIKELLLHDLRQAIGYVPQKASLFKGTIESNVKYGDRDVAFEDVELAVKIAQADEIINEKEKGYQSEISQGGGNVSGGQKQRLSIARALVKKPKIFLFDDSFSALDFKTDLKLRKALKEHTNDSTLIIVGQRISTIKYAEQIIVLEDGKIVGIGDHNSLMSNCDTYREIAYSQLSEEELS